jgi:hypothetical protein
MKIESQEEALLFLMFGESYVHFNEAKLDEVRVIIREKIKLLQEKGWYLLDNRDKTSIGNKVEIK